MSSNSRKFLLLLAATPMLLWSKSTYSDGNYSEARGDPRNCLRCHTRWEPPAGQSPPSLAISASTATVAAGGEVQITVNTGVLDDEWGPGLMLMADRPGSGLRSPVDYGWGVNTSPNANNFTYIKRLDSLSTIFNWFLKAPDLPGTYTFQSTLNFNDGGTEIDAVPGNARTQTPAMVTVTPAVESVAPALVKSVGLYGRYVMNLFSEPLDSASAVIPVNYTVQKISDGSEVQVLSATLSLNREVVTLYTSPLAAEEYSIAINNLSDLAQTPNGSGALAATFTPDFAPSYNIWAEWSQDFAFQTPDYKIMEYDEIEFLGLAKGGTHRLLLGFYMPDDPRVLLPGVPFASAKLRLRQVEQSTYHTPESRNWQVHSLAPTPFDNWLDHKATAQSIYDGINPGASPLNVLAKGVPVVDSGVPETWWEWDITGAFFARYNTPGSGANQDYWYLRLSAVEEAGLTTGVGFYGSDAMDPDNRPHISLQVTEQSSGTTPRAGSNKNPAIRVRQRGSTVLFEFLKPVNTRQAGIYNLKGESVFDLPQISRINSSRFFSWSGKNTHNKTVPAGLYILRIVSASGNLGHRFLYH